MNEFDEPTGADWERVQRELEQEQRDVQQLEGEDYALIVEAETDARRMERLFVNAAGEVIYARSGKISALSLLGSLKCYRENFMGRGGSTYPEGMGLWLENVERAMSPSPQPQAGRVPTLDVIRAMLEAKRLGNRTPVYLKSLEQYCTRFAGQFPDLAQVKAPDLESWLARFTAESRSTWANRVGALFSFAVRHDYLAANPCDKLESIFVDRKPPTILTVAQSRQLLAACPANCKPFLVLAMFAGIRPGGELMKLEWRDVSLETATVAVRFPKVRKHRRIVPLQPVAVKLLKDCADKTGRVAPSLATVKRWHRKARKLLSLERWPTDLLRHTAASYLLALVGDAARVALMLGNSPGILLSHYNDPVSKEACEAFWKLA